MVLESIGQAIADRPWLMQSYSGISGKKKELAATKPSFFGHFAYLLRKYTLFSPISLMLV
ncbi:MAG TPA: hypothetical protein VIQ31_05530 [Phormidium sp.]